MLLTCVVLMSVRNFHAWPASFPFAAMDQFWHCLTGVSTKRPIRAHDEEFFAHFTKALPWNKVLETNYHC